MKMASPELFCSALVSDVADEVDIVSSLRVSTLIGPLAIITTEHEVVRPMLCPVPPQLASEKVTGCWMEEYGKSMLIAATTGQSGSMRFSE